MEEKFIFEAKYNVPSRRMLLIQTSDETKWTVFSDWLRTQRKGKFRQTIQRITFRKENFCDMDHYIELTIRPACDLNRDCRSIYMIKQANKVLTKFIISKKHWAIRVNEFLKCPCKRCSDNRKCIYRKEFADIFRYEVTINIPPFQTNTYRQNILLTFSENITSIFEDGHFSDFVIYCSGRPLYVHKNILHARVPYFKGLLSAPLSESRRNSVSYDDISIIVMEEFLHFVYSGILRPITLPVVMELFTVANRFQLIDLQIKCSEIMEKHISNFNAASILNIPTTIIVDQQQIINAFQQPAANAVEQQEPAANAVEQPAANARRRSLKVACVKYIAQNYYLVKKFDKEFTHLRTELIREIEVEKAALDAAPNPEEINMFH